MEAYPAEYVDHNLPLIILAGLGSESSIAKHSLDRPAVERGIRLYCDLPLADSDNAEDLLRQFLQIDNTGASWNARKSRGIAQVRIKAIGREYVLSSRKAAPPSPFPSPSPPGSPQSSISGRNVAPVLHSPLSPLSPSSPLFPDGIMTPLWVRKHQDLLPACFIVCITIPSDVSDDAKVQNEVLKFKEALASFKYRGRFCVVILGREIPADSSALDERIENIRRGCSLDGKQFFFLPSDAGSVEIASFVKDIIKSLEPGCIEYYRDLSKHSRRKRNRGAVPAPTAPPTMGTSQTLSSLGWGVRYLFKLGVFAEFRQEMDAAGRNYNEAYDLLFSQEIFGSISNWSPRWNEVRLLADALALRMIRCHLWNDQPTNAVKRWRLHRSRAQRIVDDSGKGSLNYGWQAWESSWALVMAQLITRCEPPALDNDVTKDEPLKNIFASPEKAIPLGERIQPQEHLHHPGYWYRIANKHNRLRKLLAQEVPEEDRVSPGQSPASRVASRAYIYDTYLCNEPHIEAPLLGRTGFDHASRSIKLLQLSLKDFELYSQSRACDEILLAIGLEQLSRARWADALKILRPLWQTSRWRRECWWTPFSELCWALMQCAEKIGDGASVVATKWELQGDNFRERSEHAYDFHRSLDGLEELQTKPVVILRQGDALSFLQLTFSFRHSTAHVGDYVEAQISIVSNAIRSSKPVTLSQVKVEFAGSLKQILLEHDSAQQVSDQRVQVQTVELLTKPAASSSSPSGSPRLSSKSQLRGLANLTVRAQETRIFDLKIPLREEGEGTVTTGTISIYEDLFDIDYVSDLTTTTSFRWDSVGSHLRRTRIVRDQPSMINVMPRPPKLQLSLHDMRKCFYTNEPISLTLHICNEEEAGSVITLEARLIGEVEKGASLTWEKSSHSKKDDNEEEGEEEEETGLSQSGTRIQSNQEIGELAVGQTRKTQLRLSALSDQAEILIEIKALYYQQSDPETLITKSINVLLPIIGPFEANYDFSPRVHPELWPNYFQIGSLEAMNTTEPLIESKGVAQRWELEARIASFASETLLIEGAELQVLRLEGGGRCTTTRRPIAARDIQPDEHEVEHFGVVMQKETIEDRKTVVLDLSLVVNWRRKEKGAAIHSTPLAVPRLTLHVGEPRVLASIAKSSAVEGLLQLEYTFENPTMHLLTFNLSMEPNEDFAVSGFRTADLQLVPLSRETVLYYIMPFVSGAWIQPVLKVVDPYFNKNLKVSGTEGLRSDKRGLYVWVDALE